MDLDKRLVRRSSTIESPTDIAKTIFFPGLQLPVRPVPAAPGWRRPLDAPLPGGGGNGMGVGHQKQEEALEEGKRTGYDVR